jgi:hypothetical protein
MNARLAPTPSASCYTSGEVDATIVTTHMMLAAWRSARRFRLGEGTSTRGWSARRSACQETHQAGPPFHPPLAMPPLGPNGEPA